MATPAPVKEDKGRPLMPHEIMFARKIFDTDLDYSRPRVFNSGWAFFQPDNRAMAPNGQIRHLLQNVPHIGKGYSKAAL